MDAVLDNRPELTEDERSIVMTRFFAAPRRMVYEAFADPKQLAEWWGPKGFTTTVEEMDLRAGGRWLLVMQGPDGARYPNDMTFTEVVPMERIRLSLVGGREGAEPVRLHKTTTFADEGDGTRLTFRIEFVSREARDENVQTYRSVEGGRQTMERLAEFLTTKGVAA